MTVITSTCTTSTCTVATEHASRYLQQLCKHWAHKFQVQFDADQGRIVMPEDRAVTLTATPAALEIVLHAPAETTAHMRHIVDSHIARFAFREELAFDWKP
ncbi:MAG: DUF2218 domain-containing protein [Paracoccus sp. (in: a-proteobacteria)]|uniref:DUF2218 domain-containing protein n=1 Tax=Paracoccus sp. TaxID=267 RepID=UPI0039E5FE46